MDPKMSGGAEAISPRAAGAQPSPSVGILDVKRSGNNEYSSEKKSSGWNIHC